MPKKVKHIRFSIVGIIKKIALYCFLFILLLSSAILIASYITPVRQWALGRIVSIANANLIAKAEIKDLKFSPFSGIELLNVQVLTAGDTLAAFDLCTVDLDFPALFQGDILINSLKIQNPTIKLLRSANDSLWNFNKIVPKKLKEENKPSAMIIDIKSLSLESADIYFSDSTKQARTDDMFDYNYIAINNLDAEISAKIDLGLPKISFDISELEFDIFKEAIKLKNLSSSGKINSTGIYLNNLQLNTANTDFSMSANIIGYDLFENKGLETAKFSTVVIGKQISLAEIQKFVKSPIYLNGDASLFLQASGDMNNIDLQKCNLKVGDNALTIKAKAYNIKDKNKLYIESPNITLSAFSESIKQVAPELDLMKYPQSKSIKFRAQNAKITSKAVSANIDLASALGNVKGDVKIDYSSIVKLAFDGIVKNIDVAKITKNESLSSSISGYIKADCENFDFNLMKANVSAKIADSRFQSYELANFNIDAGINCKTLMIDSLYIKAKNSQYNGEYSSARVSGALDLNNFSNLGYDLKIDANSLSLSQLFNMPNIPETIVAQVNVKGSGTELDSLDFALSAHFDEISFKDKSIIPFDFTAKMERENARRRKLKIESSIIDLNLSGDFNFKDVINSVVAESRSIADFVVDKIQRAKVPSLAKVKEVHTFQNGAIGSMPKYDVNITANVKDVSFINAFTGDVKLDFKTYFQISLNSSDTMSRFQIDTLNVEHFSLKAGSSDISLSDFCFSSGFDFDDDEKLSVDKAWIDFNAQPTANINGVILKNYSALIQYQDEKALIQFAGSLNDIVSVNARGRLNFSKEIYTANFKRFDIQYDSAISLKAVQKIELQFGQSGIYVKTMALSSGKQDTIKIAGSFDGAKFTDASVCVKHYDLGLINKLARGAIKNLPVNFKANLDSLSAVMNGTFDNPQIKVDSKIDKIFFNDISLGDLSVDVNYQNKNIVGALSLKNGINKHGELNFIVRKIPIDLSLKTVENRFIHEQIDVSTNIDNFSLDAISSYIPGIKNFTGTASANINIGGYLPDKLSFNGCADVNKAEFVILATNVKYSAEGKFCINEESVSVEKLVLRNMQEDLNGGSADVSGTIKLKKFMIDSVDISIQSKKLLVMSDFTKSVRPDLYGTFIISTGTMPIRLFGDFTHPYLRGDINVLKASLFMPYVNAVSQSKGYGYKYEFVGKNKIKLDYDTSKVDTTKTKNNIPEEIAKQYINNTLGLVDLIDYDLNIKFLGQFTALMELTKLYDQLYAEISTTNKNIPLRYIKKSGSTEQKLYGDLVVKNGSTYKLYKLFGTSGTIRFPDGVLNNPTLDLLAEFQGQRLKDDKRQSYRVQARITGNKTNPNIHFSYFIDDVEQKSSDTSATKEDALYMLAFEKTKAEMTASGQSNMLNNAGVSGISSSLSAYLSKTMTEVMQDFGIKSADIVLQNSGNNLTLDQARINLTGQLFGDVVWRVGGSTSNISSDNSFSIEMPLSMIFHLDWLNNALLQLAKSTSSSANITRQQKDWELKLKFGTSW